MSKSSRRPLDADRFESSFQIPVLVLDLLDKHPKLVDGSFMVKDNLQGSIFIPLELSYFSLVHVNLLS